MKMNLNDHIKIGSKIQKMYDDSVELSVYFSNVYSCNSEESKIMDEIYQKLRKIKHLLDERVNKENINNSDVKDIYALSYVYYQNNRTPEEIIKRIKENK